MPTATFRIPDMDFATTLRVYERVCQRTGGALLRSRAGMLGRYMAASTQPARATGSRNPTGGTVAEKMMGQKAVRSDIAKIIDGVKAGASVMPARGQSDRLVLRYSAKRGGGEAGKVWLVDRDLYMESAAELHQFHQSRRLPSNGRVTTAGLRDQRQGRWKSRKVAITTKALRDAQMKKTIARVGFAKRGWLNAARDLSSDGMSRVPAWLRDGDAPGTGTFSGGARPFIRLTNNVAHAGKVLRPEYQQRALEGFFASLKKDLKFQIEYELAKVK